MIILKNQPKNVRVPSEEARARRRWLSDSFNRGVQSIEEATASARSMAKAMEQTGVLLRAPARR